jgi:hypothetical protein
MRDNFRSLDMFGQSVSFTWNGEDQYKTTYGASFSMIITLMMLAYTAYRTFYFINRLNPNVTKTT